MDFVFYKGYVATKVTYILFWDDKLMYYIYSAGTPVKEVRTWATVHNGNAEHALLKAIERFNLAPLNQHQTDEILSLFDEVLPLGVTGDSKLPFHLEMSNAFKAKQIKKILALPRVFV